jgi:acetyltransferase-like isoleucine patch superfamily enzyme
MRLIPGRLSFAIKFYLKYKGNLIRYLRNQGVKIGSNCDLLNRPENYGSEPWLIEIGNDVTLTYGVVLITHDASSRLFRKTLPGSSPYGNRFGKIHILNNCFIGINSIILPDVTIGPIALLVLVALSSRTFLPTLVAGVPARIISSLDEYIGRYQQKLVPIESDNRDDLRRELTQFFWGEQR